MNEVEPREKIPTSAGNADEQSSHVPSSDGGAATLADGQAAEPNDAGVSAGQDAGVRPGTAAGAAELIEVADQQAWLAFLNAC